jgi:predicted MFS family arabinose efflux permease
MAEPNSAPPASAKRPLWVRAALWNLPKRSAVMFFVWLFCVVAIGFSWFGRWPAVLFVLLALWYWLAANWVDRHGQWEQ